MAFDLQEQEQIDSIKAFWQQWGKLIAGVLAASAIAYLGFKGYRYYQEQQAQKAAAAYENIDAAVAGKDIAKLKSAVTLLQNDFGSSAYATRGSLILAKAAFDKSDLALAKSQLEWVLANSKDESASAIARLRLASLLLDQKAYDAAIAELNKEHAAGFDALFLDLKGDVLVAKGDAAAARDAYKSALAKLVGDSPNRQFIQTKLDALGG
ncbi:tetratricopeptide repeat protein [Chromobacterium alkanivorans]|uniref:YfgM family protein n=1 Tax=Chromobacterium alkanivorans TaxID=1071719 RepID=UPI0019674467|nr:tetratricopeptide repeat protein [Chromobacterium alkanivorans]MBN3005238.1 tetratricopeptide repeat protein [Chromobacterium alkanivorans]